jgi:hypothetical protein
MQMLRKFGCTRSPPINVFVYAKRGVGKCGSSDDHGGACRRRLHFWVL